MKAERSAQFTGVFVLPRLLLEKFIGEYVLDQLGITLEVQFLQQAGTIGADSSGADTELHANVSRCDALGDQF